MTFSAVWWRRYGLDGDGDQRRKATMTYQVTQQTTVRADSKKTTVTDVQKGHYVRVVGWENADKTVTARFVLDPQRDRVAAGSSPSASKTTTG